MKHHAVEEKVFRKRRTQLLRAAVKNLILEHAEEEGLRLSDPAARRAYVKLSSEERGRVLKANKRLRNSTK